MKKKPQKISAAPPQPLPKLPPVSVDNLREMATDMEAIWLLAMTRSQRGIECASKLARRVSFNDIQFTLMKVGQENREKHGLDHVYLPIEP